jgi:hypothetical protein
MEQIFKFWTVSNNPKQYNVHSKVNEYMGRPTNGSPRASVGTRRKRRWIGAPNEWTLVSPCSDRPRPRPRRQPSSGRLQDGPPSTVCFQPMSCPGSAIPTTAAASGYGDSYLTPFTFGTSWRAPLVVPFFERAGPIGTGVYFFSFVFIFFFCFFIFSSL